MARYFGTTRGLEVFFAASTIVMLINNLAQSNQLAEVFLPVYHQQEISKGKDYAFGMVSVVINQVLLAFIPLLLLIGILSGLLIKLIVPGFGSSDHLLGSLMFRVLGPLLLLFSVSSVMQCILNAERQFGKPEFITSLAYLAKILAISFLAKPLGVWSLVLAMWLWGVIRALGFFMLLFRIGYRYRLILRLEGFRPMKVYSQLIATFVSQTSFQFYNAVMNAALSYLPQGVYGAFKYVQQFYEGITNVAVLPIDKVFFTAFSSAFARGVKRIRDMVSNVLGYIFAIVAFFNVGILVASKPLITALLKSEKFPQSHVDLVAMLLIVFSLLMFLEGNYTLLRRVAVTLGYARPLFFSLSLAYIINAIFTWFSIRFWNINGLIASRSFFAISALAISALVLGIRRREFLVFYPLGRVTHWLLPVAAGILAGLGLNTFLMQVPFFSNRFGNLVQTTVIGSVAWFVALLVGWLTQVYEVKMAWSKFRQVLFNTRQGRS